MAFSEIAWQKAITFTLDYEAGYAENRADPGGETFRGISRNAWPAWSGWQKIDEIKQKNLNPRYMADLLFTYRGLLGDAIVFYRENFWNQIHGDELPGKLAVELFDFAVNSGVRPAVKTLQVLLNVEPSGFVGPETVKAAYDSGDVILLDFISARVRFLLEIIKKKPDQKVWTQNWFKRLAKMSNLVVDEFGLDFRDQA